MVNEPRHLTKAPIVEAMIAFDFVVNSGDLGDVRTGFFEKIKPDYPVQAPIRKAQVTFNREGSSGQTSEVGSRCVSSDGKNVCSISERTFTCSRLEPYQDWHSLRSEFQRLWEIFASSAEIQITKAAIRYINKIFIREGTEIFDSIFTYPKLADGLPQDMFGVFVRLHLSVSEPAGILIVTEAQLPPERPDYVGIALDHDLHFPIRADSGDVWTLLERARDLKNQYFFASISEDLLKEYE
jgi:uncharacterized protein (TIGR04255 family)